LSATISQVFHRNIVFRFENRHEGQSTVYVTSKQSFPVLMKTRPFGFPVVCRVTDRI